MAISHSQAFMDGVGVVSFKVAETANLECRGSRCQEFHLDDRICASETLTVSRVGSLQEQVVLSSVCLVLKDCALAAFAMVLLGS